MQLVMTSKPRALTTDEHGCESRGLPSSSQVLALLQASWRMISWEQKEMLPLLQKRTERWQVLGQSGSLRVLVTGIGSLLENKWLRVGTAERQRESSRVSRFS